MALPRQGSRHLVCDETAYRWRVRKMTPNNPSRGWRPMQLVVESTDAVCAGTLLVDLGIIRPDTWITPHQTALKPSLVREIINAARKAGWDPNESGLFVFRYPLVAHRT
jgi:hypothetical protein